MLYEIWGQALVALRHPDPLFLRCHHGSSGPVISNIRIAVDGMPGDS